MTSFLRTTSTRRLLATIAGLVVAIAAGTAIAAAAGGSGPVPAKSSLASAIHNALGAPQIQGISGRVTFTNHLIDASNLQGGPADPLLAGASGRFWLSSDHRFRLELQSDNGDAQVVAENGRFWIYDPSSQTAYEGKLPAMSAGKDSVRESAKHQGLPSIAEIQRDINQFARHLDLSGAIPGDVAGQPVYTVRVSPKHDGGLLGNVQLAWDAVHGVPLRIGIYARSDGSPVLELKVTDISYGPGSVSASDFNLSPPAGTKVVKIATPASQGPAGKAAESRHGAKQRKAHANVSGVAAVARHVPFALAAPKSLDGLGRRSSSLLDWGGHPAALITYGQNLGGVAVIEQAAQSGSAAQSQQNSNGNGTPGGLSLPTVSIKGTSAHELSTALGTVIQFDRGGVSYIVIGSVPAAAAELAAKAL